MKDYILKIAASIEPTPKGTKIPTGEIMILRDRLNHEARIYCERANYLYKLAAALDLKTDEASIRAYVERKANMEADYTAKGIKGISNRFLLEHAKQTLANEYAQICKENRPDSYNVETINKSIARFVVFNEKDAKPFHVDNEAIKETTTYYISDEQLPIYDMHRFIAALLTEFMGASIKSENDIIDYFYFDNGKIYPVAHFTNYPPTINEYKSK